MPDGVEKADPEAIAPRLRLGAGWLEARLSERRAEAATARLARAGAAMDIVALASAQRGPRRASMAVVNELAVKLRCDRVSPGLVRSRRIRLKALSHSATFQQRGRIVDAIGNAMEECLAQEGVVSHPPPLAMRAPISVAHRDLVAATQGAGAAASVPLPGRSGTVGVLTFERKGEAPFDQETLLQAEAVGTLLGPVLAIQAAGDRLVAGRVADAVRDGIATVLGKEKPSLKLAVIAAAALVAYLSFATGDYRVTSRAVLEGEVQRTAVAPFDGFVAASAVRPGDHVHAGDVLAALDDRELVLDRARAWADREKLRQKYDEAMAKHDRPTAAMLTAQIEQVDAQLELAENKLSRARIVSPLDGLLVSGDLTQMLGSPVERGKTLFEIAPADQYRIVLRTDERDLRFVSVGQTGALSLAGMPAEWLGFTVSRITPIAEAKDGKNEFRVEARLNEARSDEPLWPRLRPGMEGVGEIVTRQHHLIWIWTHAIADWMRLLVWKWWP
jgi:multidrug resistance efflux pump